MVAGLTISACITCGSGSRFTAKPSMVSSTPAGVSSVATMVEGFAPSGSRIPRATPTALPYSSWSLFCLSLSRFDPDGVGVRRAHALGHVEVALDRGAYLAGTGEDGGGVVGLEGSFDSRRDGVARLALLPAVSAAAGGANPFSLKNAWLRGPQVPAVLAGEVLGPLKLCPICALSAPELAPLRAFTASPSSPQLTGSTHDGRHNGERRAAFKHTGASRVAQITEAASDLGSFLRSFPSLFPIADRLGWVGSVNTWLEVVASAVAPPRRDDIMFRLAVENGWPTYRALWEPDHCRMRQNNLLQRSYKSNPPLGCFRHNFAILNHPQSSSGGSGGLSSFMKKLASRGAAMVLK